MQTLTILLNFLNNNFIWFFVPSGILLLSFGLINLLCNAYAVDNKKLIKASKLLNKNINTQTFVIAMPIVYQYQWQVFCRSKEVYPRDVFRFVPKKQKIYMAVFTVIAILVCMSISIYNVTKGIINAAVVFVPVCYCLAFGVLFALIKYKHASNDRNASLYLAKLVCYMDAMFGKCNGDILAKNGEIDGKETEELIDKIKFLRENGLPDGSVQKIASLLTIDKLSQPRTVDQQKRLNSALNGLVQLISHEKGS